MAAGEPQWNWGLFGNSLIKSIGAFSAIAALMLYFNISHQQASQMVTQTPDKAENALRSIPPRVIQQAVQQTKAEQSVTPATPQSPQPAAQTRSVALISPSVVRSQIEGHEGRRATAYPDTMGNMTVGVGFNLERPDARQLISQVGANYDEVLAQRQSLTDQQIDRLFDITLNEAFQSAQQFIPDLGSHPEMVQRVIVDMAFNLGAPTLQTFNRLRADIKARNYRSAAQDMRMSRWYQQVGRRGQDLVAIMEQSAL